MQLKPYIWRVALLAGILLNPKWEFSQLAPAAAKPAITIAPEKLDFPPQATGTTSENLVLNLTNCGSSSLRITDVLVSGIDFSESDTCKNPLAAGASCTIQVAFKPAITGPRLGALRISSSDAGGVRTIPLSGTGQ